jgi:hypothetical protein
VTANVLAKAGVDLFLNGKAKNSWMYELGFDYFP